MSRHGEEGMFRMGGMRGHDGVGMSWQGCHSGAGMSS